MSESAWREGYVTGGDARFYVRAQGHGDDLAVLLHGWPEDGTMWRRVAPSLVQAGWRVACPDLKGFGRSSKPRDGYDPETLADEISQLIRGLHARRAVLVGHDWGGAVALATAFRHPGRVRGLVLISAPYRQLDLRASWHIPALNIPLLPELAFRTAARPLVKAVFDTAAVVTEAFPDDVIDHYAEVVGDDPGGWLRYYRSLPRRALTDWTVRRLRHRVAALSDPRRPNRLRPPTLVVWGEEDRVTPYDLASRVAYDLEADLVTVPGVGHFVPEEDPLATARAILQLAGEGAGGTAAAAGA